MTAILVNRKTLRVAAICIVLAIPAVAVTTAQSNNTPESRTKDFYSWYLKAMVKGKDPTKNKTVTKSYLSLRFSRWYYSKAGQNVDYDVFVGSQEWADAWADNIEVTEAVYVTPNIAALHVMFTAPPDGDVTKLQVKLVKEGGKWKIDRVAGIFE